MTHSEASASFDAYFAGSLDRESVRALHLHLKTCESCQSRVRIQHAMGKASLKKDPSKELTSPETQAAIARNRDLLIKILLLLVFGWAVYRLRP